MFIKDPGSAPILLQILQAAGDAAVLLLGANQSLKPEASPHLTQALGDGNLYFCRADPHPDLELGAHGRWLLAQQRPPFGMGDLAVASAWGLAGPASIIATALDKALVVDPSDESWQLLLWLELTSIGLKVRPMDIAWTFQDALPPLAQLLEQERLRGRTLRRLKEAGTPGLSSVPAPLADRQADVPHALAEAALALDAVPLAPLAMTQVSGLPAADLVRVLAQASLVRVMALAFAEGWNEKGVSAPWVRKLVRRIAVVYPIYGGSLNLAQRSAQALERLGYQVSRIDPSRHASEVARAQKNPRESDLLIQRIEQECLRDIARAKPQALWILAQAPLGLDALHNLRRQGLLTAFWFCEDYRVRKGWKDLATTVDAFFPMQGGAFLQALRAAGAAEMPILRMAAASDACMPPYQAEDHQRRLSFFGAPYANRVSFFEALADLPLELHGEGWDQAATPLLRSMVKNGARLTEAQGFDLFRNSAININLHSSPFHRGIDREGDYVNPRAFEIAACGAFQLMDHRNDLAAAFVDGQEVATFGSVEELREQIARWTPDPKGRRQVAEAGQRRVVAEHTYEHRMAAACKALGLSPIAP